MNESDGYSTFWAAGDQVSNPNSNRSLRSV